MSTAKLFLVAMAMAAVFFVGVNARVAAHYNNHEVSCHSLSFFFCHEKFSFDNARYVITKQSCPLSSQSTNYVTMPLLSCE